MAMFAVMSGNKVINTIIADTKELAQEVTSSVCIEYTEQNPAAIGWTYNGATFEEPVEE
jgi:hypothetical protein